MINYKRLRQFNWKLEEILVSSADWSLHKVGLCDGHCVKKKKRTFLWLCKKIIIE